MTLAEATRRRPMSGVDKPAGRGWLVRVPLRVLMIEDSQDDADLVIHALRRGGYAPTCERVETADAMRAALEKGGWWDIALCDYAMAQLDAPAALVLWQESGSEQPFIVVSGAIGEEVAVVLMKAGVDDYVNKNNLTRLSQVIARELRAAETRRANARAEASLRIRDQQLRAFLENSSADINIKDAEGRYVFASRQFEKTFGLAKDEAIGKLPHDIFPSEFADVVRAHDLAVLKTGQLIEREAVAPKKHGEIVQFVSKFPISDGSGNVVGIGAFATDITERKRAEQALRGSEERYRTLVESALACIHEIDLDGRLLTMNPAGLRMMGVKEEKEIAGLAYLDIVAPDDREHVAALLNRAYEGHASEFEFTAIGNGQPRVFASSFIPIRSDDGSVVKLMGVTQDVTKRKRAEETLKESEERFRTLTSFSPVGIFQTDAKGDCLYVNDRWREIAGLSLEEATGRGWTRALHPDDCERVSRIWYETARSGGDYALEYRYKRPDGKITWTSGHARGLRNEVGKHIGHIGTIEDVTERKQAEEALRASEERFRDFAESAADLFWELDAELRFTYLAGRHHEVTGRPKEEIIGLTRRELYSDQMDDPEKREKWEQHFRHLEARRPYEFEHEWTRPDGTVRIIRNTGKPVFDSDGVFRGYRGTGRDITERKRAEEAVRASEDRFRSLIENASDVIATANTDGVITYESPAIERMLGYKPEEYIGKTAFGYMHPDDVPTVLKTYKRLIANPGSVERTVHRHRHKDGSWRILESIRKSIAKNGVTKEIVINVRDITEHKHAEQELRETVRELARSNADLRQFAHVASHDLQEPLRMVASYTELLRKRYQGKLDADADEFIEFAVDGATRMRGLIDDLLAYSRVGTQGKVFAPTDCQAVFDQVTRNLQVAIEESGAVITHNSLPTVMADKTQLVQLFQNLISNAIKFRGDETPRVHVSVKEDAGDWVFAVRDNGIGMGPEYAERIFVIFKRLHEKDEYPGTGIGLAICKKIADRHGGRIWVDSKPGKGSTFYFALPSERGH